MADGDSKEAEEKQLLKDAVNPAFEPQSPDSVDIGMQPSLSPYYQIYAIKSSQCFKLHTYIFII